MRAAVVIFVVLVASSAVCLAQAASAPVGVVLRPAAALSPELRGKVETMLRRGAEFLISEQKSDGGWGGLAGPGVAGLAGKAVLNAPGYGPEHPRVRRAVEYVLKAQRDDGGIYGAAGRWKNYETSVSLSLLSDVPRPEAKRAAETARQFLKDLQWDEGEGTSIDDVYYGGAGYGGGARPDLSNVNIMLDALRDSGLPPDDPAFQKALVFVQRCQMLGERNDQAFARGSTQGGMIYTPAHGGESKAGTIEVDGRKELRAYGTMTYAGFKSMIYAGLTEDDTRVRAALDWICANWTLDHNPNMPDRRSREGLFYYYHTFARALAAFGHATITDKLGREHDWRMELITKLEALQRKDGSWINDKDRWMEGMPELTTAYAMLALEAVLRMDQAHSAAE